MTAPDSVTTDIAAATMPELTEVDIEWLRGRLHEKHCRQCDLVRTLLAERGGEVGALAEVERRIEAEADRRHEHVCLCHAADLSIVREERAALALRSAQQPPDPLAERIEALVAEIEAGDEEDAHFARRLRRELAAAGHPLVREQHPNGDPR